MTATLDDVVNALNGLTNALTPALSPATRPTWEQQRWQPDPAAFGDSPPDVAAVDPQAAPALPPNVAANELITSAWGNGVVNSLKLTNETRPFASANFGASTVPPTTNTTLVFTGGTNIVNPDNIIDTAASCLRIPAKWPGLWLISAVFKWGSHASMKGAAAWIDRSGGRFGSIQIAVSATEGVNVTSTAVVSCAANAVVQFVTYQLNPGNVTCGLDLTCTWLGHSPV